MFFLCNFSWIANFEFWVSTKLVETHVFISLPFKPEYNTSARSLM